MKPDLVAVFRHYGVDVPEHRTQSLVCCPVHSESRASCSVSLTKQLWSCKACGAQGDAFTLIQLREGLKDFGAVAAFAESLFGVSAPVPARGSRKGLSGESRAGRRGFKPRTRRGLSDPET